MTEYLYHYDEKTKYFTGESIATLSPVDFLKGKIVFLKVPNTTDKKPFLYDELPKDRLYNWFWNGARWELRTNEAGLKRARNHFLLNKLVIEGNAILISKEGEWFIIYKEETFSLVHEKDTVFFKDSALTYAGILDDIAILKGEKEGIVEDWEITPEEGKVSQALWDKYQRIQYEKLVEDEEDTEKN